MRVLSLFDGMSCGRIALDRAGVEVTSYYASEIDKYAKIVSAANYSDIAQLGDVNNIDFKALSKIDLLIGGSPCQGFSMAGKGLALKDPRSALVFKFVQALYETKPQYFLFENVKMKRETQDALSRLIGCEPIEINSALVSAQNRKRLYWTNIPGITQPPDRGIMLSDIIENGEVNRSKSYCIDACYYKGGDLNSYFDRSRRQLVLSAKPREGFRAGVLTPAQKDKLGWDEVFYRKLTPLECERLQTVPEGYTAHVSNTQRYKMLGNGWTVDVISHILSFIS